jgi:hypothetical protein
MKQRELDTLVSMNAAPQLQGSVIQKKICRLGTKQTKHNEARACLVPQF